MPGNSRAFHIESPVADSYNRDIVTSILAQTCLNRLHIVPEVSSAEQLFPGVWLQSGLHSPTLPYGSFVHAVNNDLHLQMKNIQRLCKGFWISMLVAQPK